MKRLPLLLTKATWWLTTMASAVSQLVELRDGAVNSGNLPSFLAL